MIEKEDLECQAILISHHIERAPEKAMGLISDQINFPTVKKILKYSGAMIAKRWLRIRKGQEIGFKGIPAK